MKKLHHFDEVFDSQAVFRLLLEAMSNPTRSLSVEEYAGKLFGEHPALLTVAMTLLDNETTFCAPGSDELTEQIILLTHAGKAPLNSADYLFLTSEEDIEKGISDAKEGTLADPQKSATLIIADHGSRSNSMSFCGPGIDGQTIVMVSELAKQAVTIRDRQYYEYPQGIDMMFISEQGTLFCIPRTTHREEA